MTDTKYLVFFYYVWDFLFFGLISMRIMPFVQTIFLKSFFFFFYGNSNKFQWFFLGKLKPGGGRQNTLGAPSNFLY